MTKLCIPGFTYTNYATPEDVLVAVNWLKSPDTMAAIHEEAFDRYFSMGNFLLVHDGKVTHQELNWACHANLTYTSAKRSCVAFWCHARSHDDWKPFIKWLTTESFCAEYVLAVEEKGFVVSADIPAAVLHCIAMISRVARMFPQVYFQRWNTLVADGIHPGVAYQVTFNVNKGPIDSTFRDSSDHRAFPCPGIEGMKRFLSGKWLITDIRTYASGRGNDSCSRFLENDHSFNALADDLFKNEGFKKILSEHRRGGLPEVYTPPNPFKKSSAGVPAGCMTLREVYEVAMPYCMKEGIFDAT